MEDPSLVSFLHHLCHSLHALHTTRRYACVPPADHHTAVTRFLHYTGLVLLPGYAFYLVSARYVLLYACALLPVHAPCASSERLLPVSRSDVSSATYTGYCAHPACVCTFGFTGLPTCRACAAHCLHSHCILFHYTTTAASPYAPPCAYHAVVHYSTAVWLFVFIYLLFHPLLLFTHLPHVLCSAIVLPPPACYRLPPTCHCTIPPPLYLPPALPGGMGHAVLDYRHHHHHGPHFPPALVSPLPRLPLSLNQYFIYLL